jgi:glycosyltransferase involved in cell wall biosynthesis
LNIIIYESSSHGGCYKYAIELHQAYRQHQAVRQSVLLLPANAIHCDTGVIKNLIPDNRTGNRLHFIYRHFINPLRLLGWLRKQKRLLGNNTFVLFNDFEQLSAPLWAPLFRWLVPWATIGVFLHDANRDNYPPNPTISGWCMHQMMKWMDLALYHGELPQRPYYPTRKKLVYKQVMHGIYHLPPADETLKIDLKEQTASYQKVFAIIGHIRPEKNYHLAFEALAQLPHCLLIVAGDAANSRVDLDGLKAKAEQHGVANRVLWINRYLTESEMSAVIETTDVVLLYYSASFHAQSGILNQVASAKKSVLVSDLPNALTQTVKQYNLGAICTPDDATALAHCMKQIITHPCVNQWDDYLDDADWNRQANAVVEVLQKNWG